MVRNHHLHHLPPRRARATHASPCLILGLILVASVDDAQIQEVGELKQQIRQVVKHITPSSEPRASIESGKYTMQCVSPSTLHTKNTAPRTQP